MASAIVINKQDDGFYSVCHHYERKHIGLIAFAIAITKRIGFITFANGIDKQHIGFIEVCHGNKQKTQWCYTVCHRNQRNSCGVMASAIAIIEKACFITSAIAINKKNVGFETFAIAI